MSGLGDRPPPRGIRRAGGTLASDRSELLSRTKI